MKHSPFITVAFVLMIAANANAQVTDRIVLGNDNSEKSHGLTMYCPDNVAITTNGLSGETGRRSLMFTANPFSCEYPDIYGGEFSFVLRVDPERQNYITLRTNGGDGVKENERYRVMVENKDLTNYSTSAVTFSETKAPGAFAFNTLLIPLAITKGKTNVVVRVRSAGRYYGYGTPSVFTTYQRKMTCDMPPIYDVYSSTNPVFSIKGEKVGQMADYTKAPEKSNVNLPALKKAVLETLEEAMKKQYNSADFKPAYGNNNFNVIECMAVGYRHGYYGGTTSSKMANKIRIALDSMVYINNLVKKGVDVKVSAIGSSATTQKASSGWGGLYGEQGFAVYILRKAGQLTDYFLDRQVDLGNGTKSRREQWIEIFKESLDYGCTLSGRRTITNQLLEGSYSVYGASLALYVLDPVRFHNAPKLGLRFMREALGLNEFTGVPANNRFDGELKDDEGYPTYLLGDSTSHDKSQNNWGEHFHTATHNGNGREEGWTCTSCYGNMGARMLDMYLATLDDPYIGTSAGGNGDRQMLQMAVNNQKIQAYFTYPSVDANGNRQIVGESVTCWRNRYNPGKNFYANIAVAAISGDEELLGHVLQSVRDGHFSLKDEYSVNLFPYYRRSYEIPDAIDKLIDFSTAHSSDFKPMPSTFGQPDYVVADEEDGIVAVKHGQEYLFVNFYSEIGMGQPSAAHIVNTNEIREINFRPDVMLMYESGKTETVADVYYNQNHRITYPDNPVMADGGTVYELPAYDKDGNSDTRRRLCNYYQQQLGRYLIAQNTTGIENYSLVVDYRIKGKAAINLKTGATVTLTDAITIQPMTTEVFFLVEGDADVVMPDSIDIPATKAKTLQTRVRELVEVLQDASCHLKPKADYGVYAFDAFLAFNSAVARANFIANSSRDDAEIANAASALEEAYAKFLASCPQVNAIEVPATLNYTQKLSQSGGLTISSKTGISSASNGSSLCLGIKAKATGYYTINIKARGAVADSYKPSIKLELLTVNEYVNPTATGKDLGTQAIAFNEFSNSDYKWKVHLNANETMVLKYTFTQTTTGRTVALGATTMTYDTLLGDANVDGKVDVADITATAAYILGSKPLPFSTINADANNDATIDVADITTTANIILD